MKTYQSLIGEDLFYLMETKMTPTDALRRLVEAVNKDMEFHASWGVKHIPRTHWVADGCHVCDALTAAQAALGAGEMMVSTGSSNATQPPKIDVLHNHVVDCPGCYADIDEKRDLRTRLAAVEAERDELKQRNARQEQTLIFQADSQNVTMNSAYADELEQAASRAGVLATALARYGRHDSTCPGSVIHCGAEGCSCADKACTCGFDAALKGLEK